MFSDFLAECKATRTLQQPVVEVKRAERAVPIHNVESIAIAA
jgi:hypothetical protein